MQKKKRLIYSLLSLSAPLIALSAISCYKVLNDNANNIKESEQEAIIKKIQSEILNVRVLLENDMNKLNPILANIDTEKANAKTAKAELESAQAKLQPLLDFRNEIDKKRGPISAQIDKLLQEDKSDSISNIDLKINQKTQDKTQVQNTINLLQKDIQALQATIDAKQKAIESIDNQISTISREVSELKAKINTLKSNNEVSDTQNQELINNLKSEIASLESQKNKLQSTLNTSNTNQKALQSQIAKIKENIKSTEAHIELLNNIQTKNNEFLIQVNNLENLIKKFIAPYQSSYPEIAALFKKFLLSNLIFIINNNTTGEAFDAGIPKYNKDVNTFFRILLNNLSPDTLKIDRNLVLQIRNNNELMEALLKFKKQYEVTNENLLAALKAVALEANNEETFSKNITVIKDFDRAIKNKLSEDNDTLLSEKNKLNEKNQQLLDALGETDAAIAKRIENINQEIGLKKDELSQLEKKSSNNKIIEALELQVNTKISYSNTLALQKRNLSDEKTTTESTLQSKQSTLQTTQSNLEQINAELTELENEKAAASKADKSTEIQKLQAQLEQLNQEKRTNEEEYLAANKSYLNIANNVSKIIAKEEQTISSYNVLIRRINENKNKILNYFSDLKKLGTPLSEQDLELLKNIDKTQKFKPLIQPNENDPLKDFPGQDTNNNQNGDEHNNSGDNTNSNDNGNTSGSDNNNAGSHTGNDNPFPNFPMYNIADNEYPSYVNRYQTLNADEIYKEIWKRTFTISYSFIEGDSINSPNPVVVYNNERGTMWLLDYAKQEGNKYKLFFATNMHVLAHFSNSMQNKVLQKELNYEDPSGDILTGFTIGKSSMPSTFGSIPNKSWNEHINTNSGVMKYYTNQDKILDLKPANQSNMLKTNAFTNPQIVFAAVDYMNDEATSQWSQIIQSRWEEFKTNNSIYSAVKNYEKTNGKIPFYTDFGVIEMDVDLDQADSDLRTWFTEAIGAVDTYINRVKTTEEMPNLSKENDNYMMSLDYLSKGKNIDNDNPAFAFGLANAQNVYIGGYPGNSQIGAIWMENNPTERNSTKTSYLQSPPNNKAFAYATNNVDSPLDSGNVSIYTNVWSRPLASFYGFNYRIKFSSLYYGASGSVVYNQFGEIIGIYNGVASNVEFGDLMREAFMAPLLQTGNIQNFSRDKTIYGYNLIDGTNYQYQKASYRQNLSKIYSDTNLKTALFPNGVKK
ncbi:MIP family Ig-specific serine endopeptidase [Metamycoplasma neophronis]|uniref:DUF31 domain-containing protein n=1 Tax=Metamycoplasma neophronis TaxID=872983 RepID=A0ABY2YZZ3_9BACT|nr:hypothetical protein [Metamycoplasma neophronis]TPR54057.1 hypothetical protein FJR74_01280 [Metamycoplasma neophronis]